MVMDDDFNPADFLPVDSTFIMEIDGRPAYCVPIFLTNANRVYLDDLISDPDLTKEKRQGALAEFQKFVEKWVADKGFDLIFEEFLRDLEGDKALRVYQEMAWNDPTCAALLFAIGGTPRAKCWITCARI